MTKQKKPNNYIPCFLIVGEWEIAKEQYLKIAYKETGPNQNIEIFDGNEVTTQQILEILKTKGLFSEKKIVIVRDFKQLEKKEEQEKLIKWCNLQNKNKTLDAILILIFSPESFKKKSFSLLIEKVKFFDLRPEDKKGDVKSFIVDFLKREGKSIKIKAVELFIDLVGSSSLTAIKRELEKLVFLASDEKEITEIHIEELVFRHKTEALYKITDAIRKKDLRHALKSLTLLIEQNIPPIAILASIRNTIVRILAVKIAASQHISLKRNYSFNEFKASILPQIKKNSTITEFLNIHPYSIYLMLEAPYKVCELFDVLENMAFLDLELKGGKVNPQLVLEKFLFTILK